MRKEYNDRWNAPLVNPGFTLGEYEAERAKTKSVFQEIVEALDAAEAGGLLGQSYWDQVKARSEAKAAE